LLSAGLARNYRKCMRNKTIFSVQKISEAEKTVTVS